jgi:hypothetical protein
MKRVPVAVIVLLFGAVSQLAADTAIGQIVLQGPDLGVQTITVDNFMGDCTASGSQYTVCNSVNITNWTLELDFTSEVTGLTSPVIFTSAGSQDDIAPTHSNLDNAYSGDPQNPWSLPFDLTNPGCTPTCDAMITQIMFSGTVDQSTLQIYNGVGNPFIPETLSSQAFSLAWAIPASDYTASPGNLYDSTDITISQQPGVPEPSTIWLVLAAGAAAAMLRRTGLLSARR